MPKKYKKLRKGENMTTKEEINNETFEYPGAIIEEGNTINETESIQKLLLKDEWIQEAQQIPRTELTTVEETIINKCIQQQTMTENEIHMLEKILAKYRLAIQKIQPAETIERVQENKDIVTNEKEFLQIVETSNKIQTLPFNYPIGDKTIHILFDVYPITNSKAVLDIASNLSFFKDFTQKEKEVYDKVQNGQALTTEERIIQEDLSQKIEKISQENTEQTIIEFLSMVIKFHDKNTEPEAMKQVLSNIDLSYLTLLFNKVQEMCHIGNVNTEEVFQEFN